MRAHFIRYVEERAYDLDTVARLFREKESTWKPVSADALLKRRLGVTNGEYYYATGYALARLLDIRAATWKHLFAGKDLGELLQVDPSSK